MEIVLDKKSVELENLINKYSNGKIGLNDYDSIKYTPLNYQDFDTLHKFLDEYLNLLKEYLPYEDGSIYSAITISLSIPNVKLYGSVNFIRKPLYVNTLEEVKNNSIKEIQEKYLKIIELGYIEDNTINDY